MPTIIIGGRARFGQRWVSRGKKGRGAQFEFQQPITCGTSSPWDVPTQVPSNFVPINITKAHERGCKKFGNGPRVEFQQPITCGTATPVNFQDGDGAASGDAIASGDATSTYDYPQFRTQQFLEGRNDNKHQKWVLQTGYNAPLPVAVINNRDSVGGPDAGDAIASGTGESLADAAGAASGDAIASATGLQTYDYPQFETEQLLEGRTDNKHQRWVLQTGYNAPLPIAVINSRDGDGAASGDAIAAATGAPLADADGAASGDAIAASTATQTYDYPQFLTNQLLEQQATRQKQRVIVESQQPLTLAQAQTFTAGDGAGSAIGDAQADSFSAATYDFPQFRTDQLTSEQGKRRWQKLLTDTGWGAPLPVAVINNRDSVGAASGDAIASADATSLADSDGAASGDAIASGDATSLADSAGAASGDAIAASTATQTYDYPQFLTGQLLESQGARRKQRSIVEIDAPVTIKQFVVTTTVDGDGAAQGDSIAAAVGEALADADGLAQGDAIATGYIEDATPPVAATPPVVEGAGGVFVHHGPWRRYYESQQPKRKKKKLDELDEWIAELKSRVVELEEPDDAYERRIRVSEALAAKPDVSMREIENQIVLLKAAIDELDDEEAFFMLAA